MKNLDVNVFLLENEKLVEDLAQTTEKYDGASEQLAKANENFSHIKDEYERVQNQLERLEEMIAEGQGKISSASEIRGKLELQIGVLKEQIRSSGDNQEHFAGREKAIREQIAEREAEKNRLIEEKKSYDLELESMDKTFREAQDRVTALQEKIDAYNAEIDDSQKKLMEGLNERAGMKSEVARLDSLQEQHQIRKSELSASLLRARSDEEQQESEIEGLRKTFRDLQEEIKRLNERQSALEEKNSELTELLTQKDQAYRDAQVKYHQEKSRLDAITGITERYEGYGNSIRRVMEQKEENTGIIGVVADIIKVEKQYETAIETALGGNIQNIVTEDEATAKNMIGMLKRERAGRATFLPLTAITNPQTFKTPEVLEEKGAIALACDLVTTDKKYADVARTLLGRIVVVENVDLAFKIARKYDYGVRLVTLEGELLVPGGAVSGGAFKHSGNLLARRREMDELENGVKKHLKQIDTLLSEIESAKEDRKKVRRDIEEMREQIQRKFIEQNTARLNVMTAEEKKEQAGAGLEQLRADVEQLEKELAEIGAGREEALRHLSESEAREKELKALIEKRQAELDGLAEEEAAASDKAARLHTEAEMSRQKQGFMQQNVDRIAEDIQRIRAELEEVIETLENSRTDTQQKEEDIKKLTETIEASYEAQDEDREKVAEYTRKKQELTEKQKNFFNERESLSDQISSLDKEVYRLEAQRARMQESIDSRISYMWNEYEITLSDAREMRNEEMTDLAGMKKEIGQIKDELKGLGEVNVNAIEEYRELMERYTFMSDQHDDLVGAEEKLKDLITELDENMRLQFTEKFEQISVEFDKVFKEMFGGGQGTLELQEEEDVLEAGIRIIAQPPGKKLQNMMQLSGGEKALTAIALLFAIQNLKPSPFCLLDEIEAALDDSNVGRFAGYLHKLTRHTQFIVITHRRGTMERADRLYGITMREKGVSALVSVDLIEKDLSA